APQTAGLERDPALVSGLPVAGPAAAVQGGDVRRSRPATRRSAAMSSAPGMIGVLLVHPHQETARYISTLLAFEYDVNLVATCATGEEAVRKVGELSPRIVLLAGELPDGDSTRVIRQIAPRAPGTGVIVISTNDSAEYMRRCMQVGARFVLPMPFN